MKRLLSVVFTLCMVFIVSGQETSSDYIFFDHDNYELSLDEQFHLSMICNQLKSYSKFTTQIYGHTDIDGTSSYNEALSIKRANSVFDYMVLEGVNPQQLTIKSFGEYKPMYNGTTEESKAKNRRVEIFTDYSVYQSIGDLISKVDENPSQYFQTDPLKNKTLFLEKGSTIKIPANSFEFEDGTTPSGNINIEVIESFSYTEFIKDGLFTMSGDQILETGGMMYINATSEGLPLNIKNDQSIEILYPEQKIVEGMELFYGKTVAEGPMDWIPTNEPVTATEASNNGNSNWEGFDFSAWLDFDLKIPPRPYFDIESLPSKPGLPRKANDARKPNKPELADINLQKSKFNLFFMSKNKKENLKQEEFEKALIKYENDLILYEDGHQKYLARTKEYKKEYPIAIQRIGDWEDLARKKMTEILEYRSKLKQYYDAVRVQRAQRYLKKNLNEISADEMYFVFLDMINQPLQIDFSYNFFSRVYGRNYLKIIQDLRLSPGDVRKIRMHASNAYLSKLSNMINTENIESRFKRDGKIGTETMNRYVANISQLGWINVDKFNEFDESEALQMAIREKDHTKFYIVFKDQKTMISPTKANSHYVFNRLQKGEKIKLVGIKLIDAKPYLFEKDFVMDSNKVVDVDYRSTTLDEIKALFESLDGLSS